jgi:hypothetical protein
MTLSGVPLICGFVAELVLILLKVEGVIYVSRLNIEDSIPNVAVLWAICVSLELSVLQKYDPYFSFGL